MTSTVCVFPSTGHLSKHSKGSKPPSLPWNSTGGDRYSFDSQFVNSHLGSWDWFSTLSMYFDESILPLFIS